MVPRPIIQQTYKGIPDGDIREQVIEYGGCANWTQSSPNLTSLEFFLRDYLKVYEILSKTLQIVRHNI